MDIQHSDQYLLQSIKSLLTDARKRVVSNVNSVMVYTYFEIGRHIVEFESEGNNRGEYGKEVLKKVSKELTQEFGKGFSETNLRQMRSFYVFQQKQQTVSDELNIALSWSHYLILMRLEEGPQNFYERECIENSWSVRELQRQIDSALYERIALSQDKGKTLTDSLVAYHSPVKPRDVVKDPYILDFLGLEGKASYSESDLEQAIIDRMEEFLLEMGKGFSFVGRQKRFSFDEEHFYVDLVFYNRLLKCFVLIDLKVGKLKHQDLGQMQMYVNYYDRYEKLEDENPTIGILLCQDKKESLVRITLPEDSNIYASKYHLYLPTKEEFEEQLKEVVERC